MGCTCGQGYGICRPMPYENVRGWLEMWNTERNGTRLRA
jgi:EAL domain-containing protein (putative c-di-GMP-specific phosphodiesterase class I)